MSLFDEKIGAPEAEPAPAVGRGLGLALLVIATAQLMLVLDDTIVNVALPTIQRSLHLPPSHLNWVASFYALTFAVSAAFAGAAGIRDDDGRVDRRTLRIAGHPTHDKALDPLP